MVSTLKSLVYEVLAKFNVLSNYEIYLVVFILTDTGEDSKLVHRRKRPKVDASIFLLFFGRVRATSMTQRRVENTRVHFWTFSPVSVKLLHEIKIDQIDQTVIGPTLSNRVDLIEINDQNGKKRPF